MSIKCFKSYLSGHSWAFEAKGANGFVPFFKFLGIRTQDPKLLF